MYGKVNCQRYKKSDMKNDSDKIILHYIQKIKLITNIKYKTHPSDEKPGNFNIVKSVKQKHHVGALALLLL